MEAFQRVRKEQLDAAIVVGPATMHYEVGLACIEAGIHVFIEKPSASTVEDARRLEEPGVVPGHAA